MADAEKSPAIKAAEAAARVSDFRTASLKASAKRRASRTCGNKSCGEHGNEKLWQSSPTAAKAAAASTRPKAAPPKRVEQANTWPSMLQVRPSVKTRSSAQDSVDLARAMAREGVRLRSEAAS